MDTIQIEGNTFKIGNILEKKSGEIYKINGRWYKERSLFFDERLKKYRIRKTVHIHEGIIDIEKNGNIITGLFSIEDENNISIFHVSNREIYEVLDEKVLYNYKFFRKSTANGEWYDIRKTKATDITFGTIDRFKRSLYYNSKPIIKEYSDYYKKVKLKIDNDIEKISKSFFNYTFGIEFETINGFIDKKTCKKNGIMPLRDGSINGIEYTTIPLQKANGLQTVKNITKLLNNKTIFDDTCALHIHIGGMPRSKKFILAFYKVMFALQNEYFAMFPIQKKYNNGIKRKNYTAPFNLTTLLHKMDSIIHEKNIDNNFNTIYEWLTEYKYGSFFEDISKITEHPADVEANRKWNIHSRYHYINLIPLIFGNKQTIEFRIHPPTFSIDKILLFMLLNIYIIKFVEDNIEVILKGVNYYNLELQDIVYYIDNKYGEKSENRILYDYIKKRKSYASSMFRKGDVIGKEEHFYIKLFDNYFNIENEFKPFEHNKKHIAVMSKRSGKTQSFDTYSSYLLSNKEEKTTIPKESFSKYMEALEKEILIQKKTRKNPSKYISGFNYLEL